MTRNLVLLVDASANLTPYRSEVLQHVVRGLLMNLREPQTFALVAFNQELTGYETGIPQPIDHREEALSWLNNVTGSNRADLAVLLERVVHLPEPTDVVLLACGFIGREDQLLWLASQAPQTMRIFGTAVDCECSLLERLCRKSVQCRYEDWQSGLRDLIHELRPPVPEPPPNANFLASTLAASSSLVRRGEFTTLRLEGPEGLALLSGQGAAGVYQEYAGNSDCSYDGQPVRGWKLGVAVRAGHGLVHGYCKMLVGDAWIHLAFHHLPVIEYDAQGAVVALPESAGHAPVIELKRPGVAPYRPRPVETATAAPEDWI